LSNVSQCSLLAILLVLHLSPWYWWKTFPHLWLVNKFVTRVTQRMPRVGHELKQKLLCFSFSICTFVINHHFLIFSQFKHLSYNMRSYYDCFVTWNRKTLTLDIFARHPKTDVALLCVGPKLWKFGILYTILSTFIWSDIRIECFLIL
jgi:hypothetical protein